MDFIIHKNHVSVYNFEPLFNNYRRDIAVGVERSLIQTIVPFRENFFRYVFESIYLYRLLKLVLLHFLQIFVKRNFNIKTRCLQTN